MAVAGVADAGADIQAVERALVELINAAQAGAVFRNQGIAHGVAVCIGDAAQISVGEYAFQVVGDLRIGLNFYAFALNRAIAAHGGADVVADQRTFITRLEHRQREAAVYPAG